MQGSSRRRFEEFRKRFRVGAGRNEGLHAPESRESDEPATSAPRPKWGYLRFYFQWLRPYSGQIVFVFALALLASILGLVPPYVTKEIIDKILPIDAGLSEAARKTAVAERLVRLHLAGLFVLVLLVTQQGIEATRQFKTNHLNLRVLRKLQQRLYDHLMRLPIHELQRMKTGAIVTRLSSDVEDVSGLLRMALFTPGVAAFRIAATLVILVSVEWRMALVCVAILVPIIAINLAWIRKLKPLHRSIRHDRGEVNARVVETFGGLPVVRVFRRERKEARDFTVGQNVVIRKRLLTRLYYLGVSTAWGLLVPLASLLIIWYGGTLLLVGQLTLGEIVMFQMFVFMLMMPISQIVQSWGDTQLALAALERTVDVMQRSVDLPDRPHAVDAPPAVDEIRFEDVYFSYDSQTPVLQGISLTVLAGQAVALVGHSGAGKTTLTNLVARFYDPCGGRILLNGVDLRDIKLASYRSLLGMVQQDVFLFDGTLRENIAYGRRGANLGEIIEAARRANAHEFISRFPDAYDTVIGERGVKLSGGQKQRVSIARAILADPQILILDEATSNLDSESEQLIQASLVDLLADRTTFVIAHRLSTVTRADLILVMADGRIVERGTHAELMAADGVFAEMVTRQVRLHTEQFDATGGAIDRV